MPAIRTTSLLSFHPPVVNGGEVVLPVFARGELHGLSATPAMWANILAALAPYTQRNGLQVKSRRVVPDRSINTPEQIANYREMWKRYISTPGLSVRVCADELGLGAHGVGKLTYWFDKFAEEPGAPALKPGGKLT